MHMQNITATLRIASLNTLGFVLLFTLPMLWMAWTPTVIVVVACTGLAAAALYCVVYAVQDRIEGPPGARPEPHERALDDDALAALIRIAPSVHRNRGKATAEFQSKLKRFQGAVGKRK